MNTFITSLKHFIKTSKINSKGTLSILDDLNFFTLRSKGNIDLLSDN